MKIKFKKLNQQAVVPTNGSKSAAGYDLVATSKQWNHEYQAWMYGTGIAVEIPEGYEGQIRARSSVFKTGLVLSNGVGTIDSDYRGEIKAVFYEALDYPLVQPYNIGDRICQLVIAKCEDVEYEEVEELSETERGEGGYGSTGK